MLRLLAVAATAAIFATPAFAMDCTKPEIDKMNMEIKGTTDKVKQDMAMKEMKMAEDMMAKKDMKGCVTHMDNASKAMGKKM